MPRLLLRTKTSGTVVNTELQNREMVYDNTTNEICVRDNSGTLRRFGTGGVGANIAVQDEGTTLTSALSSLNFVGAGATATNVGGAVTVDIPASSLVVQDEGVSVVGACTRINFVGAGVTATGNFGAVVTIPGAGSTDWASITGKPSVFPPSAHTHPSTDITDFVEAVQDAVAALLTAGTNVTLNYNDVANTLTINATGGGGNNNMARKAAYFYGR